MEKVLIIVLVSLAFFVKGQVPWDNGNLKVSENGRYLQHENGTPFFWLSDTGWLLFQRLDRDEAKQYIENRKGKGFNVIQCIFNQNFSHTNAYGDTTYSSFDITKPIITPGNNPNNEEEYDYWDHVDYIVDLAAEYGIYIGMTTTWRDLHNQDKNLNKEKAEIFAAHLANHFKSKPNIIWINGGSAKGNQNAEFWETVGVTIKKNDPNHLITFHPFGRLQSSTWFNNSSWLDVNMFTSGHRNYEQDDSNNKFGEDNWRYALDDLSKTPLKPTIDGEASYENLPQGIHDHSQVYWKASDVRRYAYWSVFAGSCGHVYGENTVRQIHIQGVNKPESGAKLSFFDALDAEGAFEMQYVKNLVLSRPYFERINDQSVVAGDEGKKYKRIIVSRGNDYLMAYNYTGREFTIQMGKISGDEIIAWWYDTKTGEAYKQGTYKNSGLVTFDPPGVAFNGNDWVLVLDNEAKKFSAPGVLPTQ